MPIRGWPAAGPADKRRAAPMGVWTHMVARPAGAIALLDGDDLSRWRRRDGQPAGWSLVDGVATVVARTGDIVSVDTFRDALIHVEFCEPDMPEATGQRKGNSGIFVQGRYEVQVLDSYGWKVPGKGDCGAIYNQHAPLVNACLPPLQWQAYDIFLRAARVDAEGKVLSNARLTVLLNGQVIHNNVEVLGPTGAAVDQRVGEPGPLLLQDHGNPVRFRNVWFLPLPLEGSEAYAPSDG